MIRREIEVTRKGLPRPIDVTYGTNLIPIEFVVTDFAIPEGVTAKLHAMGASKVVKSQDAEVSGNKITFTPEIGFFDERKNVLQIAIEHEGKNLFSFEQPVTCHYTMKYTGALNLSDGPTFVEMVLELQKEVDEIKKNGTGGVSKEQIKNAVNEYLDENPVASGATEEQAAQIEQNKSKIEQIQEDVKNKEESGTAENKVTEHNVSIVSHNDIRLLIKNLTNAFEAFMDIDDESMNQATEFVAYMKDNRELIEQITTSKVSVSDIVDDYVTNVSNKPVSAAVAVKLKALIDAITVPTLLSQLGQDATHRTVTDAEKESWNNKANKATTLAGYGITDGATKEEVSQISEQIADQQEQKADYAYVDNEIAVLKAQSVQNTPLYPLEGTTLAEEIEWLSKNGDKTKLYLLSDGYVYGWRRKTETVIGGTVTTKGKVALLKDSRYSASSNGYKTQSGYHSLVIPIVSDGTSDVITISLKNATWTNYYTNLNYGSSNVAPYSGTATLNSGNTGSSEIQAKNIASGNQYLVILVVANDVSNIGVTVDGEVFDVVTSSNGSEATFPTSSTQTETVIKEGFFNTGVVYGANIIVDTMLSDTSENPIQNKVVKQKFRSVEAEIETLKENSVNIASYIGTIQAPTPQLPADNSAEADLNLLTCQSNDLHNYLNDVVARYPNYIVRELLGKDESGTLDIYRYTMSKHVYTAWQKANYPKMYGWVNGSTVIYSLSVSPRIGDTMYSTKYVGTSFGTVSAVSSANRTRTVNGTVFIRSESNDVSPTLVYSQNIVVGTSLRNSALATVDSISAINGNTVTSANGDTYYRYPFGDLDKNTNKRIPMTIIANEHGGNGEPRDCSLIVARFIRDLCENKYQDNPIFNYIREKVNLTVIPCVNPHGWNRYDSANGYRNANGVNINRNYDTPGWDVYLAENPDEASTMGEYAGSENECQYVMNTMSESGAKIAMSVHGIDNAREQLVCYYQGQNPNGAYSETKISEIYEDYLSRYGLRFVAYNPLECPPETTSKSPSYITQIGAYGGIIEFNNNDAQIKEGGANRRYTAWTMEQQYTLLLKFLAMWISDYEENA